jgi:hypothetical protein
VFLSPIDREAAHAKAGRPVFLVAQINASLDEKGIQPYLADTEKTCILIKGAICAPKLRKRVAVIDLTAMMGGVCVHTGTIPSKSVREAIFRLTGLAWCCSRRRHAVGTLAFTAKGPNRGRPAS